MRDDQFQSVKSLSFIALLPLVNFRCFYKLWKKWWKFGLVCKTAHQHYCCVIRLKMILKLKIDESWVPSYPILMLFIHSCFTCWYKLEVLSNVKKRFYSETWHVLVYYMPFTRVSYKVRYKLYIQNYIYTIINDCKGWNNKEHIIVVESCIYMLNCYPAW